MKIILIESAKQAGEDFKEPENIAIHLNASLKNCIQNKSRSMQLGKYYLVATGAVNYKQSHSYPLSAYGHPI